MTKNNDVPLSSNEFKDKDQDSAAAEKIQDLEQQNSELQEKISSLENEKETLRDQALRSRAELDNTLKRTQIDVEKARTYGSQKLLEDLIPVIDSLELGIANSQGNEYDKSHTDGMNMTLEILMKTIQKHGIEQINPAGEEFNPEYHEAMTLQPTKEVKPNSIIDVLQKGYVLKSRLIRPARVIVAKELT